MKKISKTKRGKIDISELNVPSEKHEYETAKYFANRGLLTLKGTFDIIKIR